MQAIRSGVAKPGKLEDDPTTLYNLIRDINNKLKTIDNRIVTLMTNHAKLEVAISALQQKIDSLSPPKSPPGYYSTQNHIYPDLTSRGVLNTFGGDRKV